MSIIKRRKPYPKHTHYQEYKKYLQEDFDYRCAYCSIHENEWGGLRHFHVEHFKPKAKYPKLVVSYGNLMYACDVCNTFKGSDWPGYIDPCKEDYENHFSVDLKTGEVYGCSSDAKYMVERLHLNRRHLKLMRQNRADAEMVQQKIELIYRTAISKVDSALAYHSAPEIDDALVIACQAINMLHQLYVDDHNKRWIPKIKEDDLR